MPRRRNRGAYQRDCRDPSTYSTASRSLSKDSRHHPRSPSPRNFRGTRSFGKTSVPRRNIEITDEIWTIFQTVIKSTYIISQAKLCNASDGDTWIFDSGTSHHFCSNRNLLVKFNAISDEQMIVDVKGISFPIEGKRRDEVTLWINSVHFYESDVLEPTKTQPNISPSIG